MLTCLPVLYAYLRCYCTNDLNVLVWIHFLVQYVNLDRFGSGGDPNTSGGKGGAAGASLSVLPLVRAVAATGYTPDILFGGPADGIGPSGTAETTRNASSGPGDLLKRACYADLPRRWLLLSGKDTGSAWHVDPLNTSAWNTLLIGHKRWALLPRTTDALLL